jgi:hypothetical protein
MMDNIAVTNSNYFKTDNIRQSVPKKRKYTGGRSLFTSTSVDLDARGGVSLFRYLKSLNLSRETNLLFLPSNHHYFYDEEDFKNVKLLINLRKLNHIKDPDKFLNNLGRIMPLDINFIGCFSENSNITLEGFLSGLSTMVNNLLDFRTDNRMDKETVSLLLRKNGFKVMDMTEMNGLTYFFSRNMRDPLGNIA